MKRRLPLFAVSLLLSLAGAMGAVGCPVTAFGLQLAHPVRMLLLWLAAAAVCAAVLSRGRGMLWLLLLYAGAIGAALLLSDALKEQTLGTLGRIVQTLDSGYGMGVPETLQVTAEYSDLPMTFLGLLMVLFLNEMVWCHRLGDTIVLYLLLISLGVCLLMTDTVPSVPALFLLLLCSGLVLLTEGQWEENDRNALRLVALLLIPCALALVLLFRLVPRETYENRAPELRERLGAWMEDVSRELQERYSLSDSELDSVELAELSDLPRLGLPVAEVTAEQGGPIYLRVQDYDVYTGSAWRSTPNRQSTLTGSGRDIGTVQVQTREISSAILLPSFPHGQVFLTEGIYTNVNGRTSFFFSCQEASLDSDPPEQWLELPASSVTPLRELVKTLPGDVTAESIAAYVRSCARYDRSPDTMPRNAGDFALWFLTRAEAGYCTHFAASAAALLRAAGIPARLVTGYRVEAPAGKTVEVTSDDAHAWAEYYDYGSMQWLILEVTPPEPAEAPTEATAGTGTETTEPSTRPTAETTAPPSPTAPTEPREETARPYRVLPAVLLLAAALLPEGQRRLRLRLRRRARERGDENRRAVACWQEVRRMSRLLKTPPPRDLHSLTQKALYSRQGVTEGELARYTDYLSACRKRLGTAPLWKRLLYRYWYAAI